jgi:hypothetical protein
LCDQQIDLWLRELSYRALLATQVQVERERGDVIGDKDI